MALVPGPSNVTISLLPVSLSLARIPRSRLPQLLHPILRQILQPGPVFLNITCNEIELSLFAEHNTLAELEFIARRDRHRQRSRASSGSARKRPVSSDDNQVECSCEKWRVLQLDSHSDQFDNSGARVHELSAPLAAAGISILYQSSYMSDFIIVKESRLREVISLFGATGFDLYSSDPEMSMSRVVSPLLSPVLPDVFQVSDSGPEFSSDSGAVLTRTRSSIDTPATSIPSAFHLPIKGTEIPHRRFSLRDKSHSPSSTDVTILPSKLVCVGLNDESVDSWSLKVVKLVAFPDLIPVKESHFLRQSRCTGRGKKLGETTFSSFPPWRRKGSDSTDSVSPSSSEEDGGYLSHSPYRDSPLVLPTSSRSYPDLSHAIPSLTPSFKPTAKHLVSQVHRISPMELKSPSHSQGGIRLPADKQVTNMCPTVPFFSFTRTSEGSSLTTDVTLLAALFPSGDRDMLICAGELDALDVHATDFNSDSDQDESNDTLSEGGSLQCLQIDLRRFGLDKHGLVNRYSRVLEEHGINHMYSSTFKTANLLVTKAHATRARDLLRSC